MIFSRFQSSELKFALSSLPKILFLGASYGEKGTRQDVRGTPCRSQRIRQVFSKRSKQDTYERRKIRRR